MNITPDELLAIEARIAQIDPAPAPQADSSAFLASLSGLSLMPAGAPGTALPGAPPPAAIEGLIQSSAQRNGVDPALVRAVVAQESGFDPYATSGAGAQGLMQLMPQTAQQLGVGNPYDAAQNIEGGTRYLRSLLDRFGGDVRRAVAAYNAGPGAVERYDGVPPYAETQNYVAAVLDGYRQNRAV